MLKRTKIILIGMVVLAASLHAVELHVAIDGNDSNPGTISAPLRTIQRGASLAQPGDIITVHAGVYRERINPPRGGNSDTRRIVYRAAPGEKVEIKGSEPVKGWVKIEGDVWQVTIPNAFFGEFNPYNDLIAGDWFKPKGRKHHTGAVYLNGEWLAEAASMENLFSKERDSVSALIKDGCLLNVAWFRVGREGNEVPAIRYAAQATVKNAPCVEGGECIGWIEAGDWVRYDDINFGDGTTDVKIRVASATAGGVIELRLDSPEGELLGKSLVPNTGGWQSWSSADVKIKPTAGIKRLCMLFKNPPSVDCQDKLWWGQVDKDNTTIMAQFKGVDPNKELVEINVRRTIFYPDKPGRNYITVRDFIMRHAATPWAPPTAEQIGLIGTHWSKGWIIEGNTVSHSICSGISLGKYGDAFDNTSDNSAKGYIKTIERSYAHTIPWTKENIGNHVVRNNHISHCEQAGIVGSLGCAFSTVTDNTIHDIHVRRLFGGAEMAGIKFHGPIDVEISGNLIFRTTLGLWLDWMSQGTRVSRNLLYSNARDVHVEVNHGPFLFDNNLFLSDVNLIDASEGGAYVYNLFAGKILSRPQSRITPYHPAHCTSTAGMANIEGGDNRFYNNVFVRKSGMSCYDRAVLPIWADGNIFFKGTTPCKQESAPTLYPEVDPSVKVIEDDQGIQIDIKLNRSWSGDAKRKLITNELLGTTKVSGCMYENPDGSPIIVNTDFLGVRRSETDPMAGPFEKDISSKIKVR
jgi:alpha-L-arabinofuranosidase